MSDTTKMIETFPVTSINWSFKEPWVTQSYRIMTSINISVVSYIDWHTKVSCRCVVPGNCNLKIYFLPNKSNAYRIEVFACCLCIQLGSLLLFLLITSVTEHFALKIHQTGTFRKRWKMLNTAKIEKKFVAWKKRMPVWAVNNNLNWNFHCTNVCIVCMFHEQAQFHGRWLTHGNYNILPYREMFIVCLAIAWLGLHFHDI